MSGICLASLQAASYVIQARPFIRCSAQSTSNGQKQSEEALWIALCRSPAMYAPRSVDSDDDDERSMWVAESAPPARPNFSWKALMSRSKKAAPQGAEEPSSERTQQESDMHKADSAVKTLKKRLRILIDSEDHPDGQKDAAKAATASEEEAVVPALAASAGTTPALHSATSVNTPDRSVELLREFINLTTILMEFYRLTKTPPPDARPPSNTHSEQTSSHPSYPGSEPRPPIDSSHDRFALLGPSTLPFGPDGPMQAAALPANSPPHGLNAAYYQSFPSDHEQQQGAAALRPPHMSDADIRNSSSQTPRQDHPNHLAHQQYDYRAERAAASVNPQSGRNGINTDRGQAQVDQERDMQTLNAKLKAWPGRQQRARRHRSDNVGEEVPVDLIDCIKAIAHCIGKTQLPKSYTETVQSSRTNCSLAIRT